MQFQVAMELWLRCKGMCMSISELNGNEVKMWWYLIFQLHGVGMFIWTTGRTRKLREEFPEMGFKEEEQKVRENARVLHRRWGHARGWGEREIYGKTWLSCWSRLGPWQKWSVWLFQLSHPLAPPQNKSRAQTQGARPHPPHWCALLLCPEMGQGSENASLGEDWILPPSGCSFSCFQNSKAERQQEEKWSVYSTHVLSEKDIH